MSSLPYLFYIEYNAGKLLGKILGVVTSNAISYALAKYYAFMKKL